MTTKHTPGPWHVDTYGRNGELFVKPIPGQIIAEIDPSPNQAADARLIAAAPELLERCNLLANILERHCAQSFILAGGDRILKETRELIAKAEGAQ